MMLARVFPLQVAKEIRALLPVWILCLSVMAAGAAMRDGSVYALGALAYGVGSIALGALSIGHEYTHRTLPMLLSQPRQRARAIGLKLCVLAVMLATLAAVAWASVLYPSRGNMVIVGLSMMCGLCMAPLLTMLARNPLAGIMFTLAIPGMVWLPIDWLAAEPIKLTVFWRAMAALCAIAAVLGWRTFLRLEATEGRGPHVHVEWSSPGPVPVPDRSSHPVWRLAMKELRLQQLTFVVFGIYLLGSLKTLGHVSEVAADVHGALTGLYSCILAVLIGSLASAEEREHGTLEAQLLLPIASSTQWMVKAVVAIGLALLLAVAVPALIIASRGRAIRIDEWYATGILILTVTGLYVSSLNSTGIHALLVSFLCMAFVIPVSMMFRNEHRHLTALPAVMLAGFLPLVLWFGLENHRSLERGAWRIGRQVFVMAGCLALAGTLLAVL